MSIFLLKTWAWLLNVWDWAKENWKITVAALSAAAIFAIGFIKGSKGKRKAEALRDLAEKDADGYKKNSEDYEERVKSLVEDHTSERDKIEEQKNLSHAAAKRRAAQKKEELENDPEKLDKILKDKYNLDGR